MNSVAVSRCADLLGEGNVREPLPRVQVVVNDRGHLTYSFPEWPEADVERRLMMLLGTSSPPFVRAQLDAILQSLSQGLGRPPEDAQMEGALALIDGIGPANELEAVLAVQMAITHAVSLRLAGRLMKTDPLRHDFEGAGIIASKFMRAFAAQVEALAKLRRPSVQLVRVERINISDGGKAIVGDVYDQRRTQK